MKLKKTKLGKVSKDEADEVEYPMERMFGLEELQMIVPDSDHEMKADIGAEISLLKERIKKWWDAISAKYGWPNYDNILWQIDFLSLEVFILNQ